MKRILSLFILLIIARAVFANVPAVTTTIKSSSQNTTVTDTAVITIPVVIHVVFNTAGQNISDAQIMSQLAVLNKDYGATNADRINIPAYFAEQAGNAHFEFHLATVDPSGYSTNGIIRKQTTIQLFGTDDRIKSSAIGGDDPWNRNKYLNIWVCNLAGGILGYTSKIDGAAEKDGVVIQYSAFGTTGTVSAPFNLGRTCTHEVGHWLNLIHIWGDTYCGDDQVDDTPRQRASNRGRPSGEKFTCDMTGHGDMYMNFMDLTDDAGMFMFTQGQCKRMRASFGVGGQRHEILASNALTGSGIPRPVEVSEPLVVAKQMMVFPNPASSIITIDLNSAGNDVSNTIIIYNNIGQPVISQTMTGSRMNVNVTNLKTGIYFVKQSTGSLAGMTKFFKN